MLVALLAAGIAVRLVLAFSTDGVRFDLESMTLMERALRGEPFEAYETLRWPYPPGFLPFLLGAGALDGITGLAFTSLVRLPSIAADVGIALLVAHYRRDRAGGRAGLAAAALVLLGPSFVGVSGFHGQIDAVAVLPAVIAVVLWERDVTQRAAIAGLLIGVGAAMKTVPIFLLLAMLPTVRNVREALALVGCAVAVPAAMLTPFLLTNLQDTLVVARYRGLPGGGGLSLLAQPSLAERSILQAPTEISSLSRDLFDAGRYVVLLGLAVTAAALMRWRPPVLAGAILTWLALYVFGVNFFTQYAVWLLPFLLLAGRLELALGMQLLLLPAGLVAYTLPHDARWLSDVYVVSALSFFFVALAAYGYLAVKGPHRVLAPPGLARGRGTVG